MKLSKTKKNETKATRLLLMGYNLVKNWSPPPLDIVLVEEDDENFYGYPVGYDKTQCKITFGHAMVGTYKKSPTKSDPSYWTMTWRKTMQDQTA